VSVYVECPQHSSIDCYICRGEGTVPELGSLTRGSEIGRTGSGAKYDKYVSVQCPKCGYIRYVIVKEPQVMGCKSCAHDYLSKHFQINQHV